MSILATAGRAKIYNTDGTGRDTYCSQNSGGFTMMNMPASAWHGGSFGAAKPDVSAQHIARGGGQGSPGKTIHYQVNGTGRDSYIHSNHGGFAFNYAWKSDQDAYVNSLRGYPTTVQQQMRATYNYSKKAPQKDHFVEGQCSLRSPKARNDLQNLKEYQEQQSQRLSLPRKKSNERFDQLERSHNQKLMMATSSQRFSMLDSYSKNSLGRSAGLRQQYQQQTTTDSQNNTIDTSNILRRHARNATTTQFNSPNPKIDKVVSQRRFMSPEPHQSI